MRSVHHLRTQAFSLPTGLECSSIYVKISDFLSFSWVEKWFHKEPNDSMKHGKGGIRIRR
jgi:hypothetical protein